MVWIGSCPRGEVCDGAARSCGDSLYDLELQLQMREICRPFGPWVYAFWCGELFGLLHCTVVVEEVGVDRIAGFAREFEESDCW